MNNKLIIAAAGSGKTTLLVREALKVKGKILITTFTEANEQEIRKKIIQEHGCIPGNIVIQTWFSFLLQHGVRPYQGYLTDEKITGMLLVNQRSGLKTYNRNRQPIYFSEEKEFKNHYFTSDYKIYSDKIAKFACRCNDKSDGAVIDRLQEIYSNIFIDEIQDLAGYDLEIVKLLLKSTTNLLMVGDPRQVTYHTHDESKYSKYKDGKIKDFILSECKKVNCDIDKTTLNLTYRNNSMICNFSAKLYPEYESCQSNQEGITGHCGIFLVNKKDVDEYLKKYNPLQLRDNIRTVVNNDYKSMNIGVSKGLTFERVLIYPTTPIIAWLKNHSKVLTPTTRSKFYVALTRAMHSVAIVFDYNKNINIDGIEKYESK